jgi:D-3-phosphoglycerate dehydrogenase / 2-oxoglutarate reductase
MIMKNRIVISAPYMIRILDTVRDIFISNGIEIIVPEVKERLEEYELIPLLENADAIICGDDRITSRVLKSAKRLKLIYKWGTGIDSIDVDACREYGVKIRNTLNAFTEPVSDTVMAYILSFSRRINETNKDMHEGIWEKKVGCSLSECTLGVIGVGNIGKAVSRRAIPFGMRVCGNDIKEIDKSFLDETPIDVVSLDQLLSESDFISLNCDLNPSSHHLVNASRIDMMKKGVVLINTARGPIVNEADLVVGLQSGHIAGAGLDVFEEEPLPDSSPLMGMDNVLMSPHNSNSSPRAWDRVNKLTIQGVIDELSK